MYKYDDIWFEIDFKIDLLHKQNKQKLGSFEMTFYHEDFESYFEKEFGEDLVAKEIWKERILDIAYDKFYEQISATPSEITVLCGIDLDEDMYSLNDCVFAEEDVCESTFQYKN